MRSYNLGGFFYMSLRYDVLILFSENTFNIYFLESINTCQKNLWTTTYMSNKTLRWWNIMIPVKYDVLKGFVGNLLAPPSQGPTFVSVILWNLSSCLACFMVLGVRLFFFLFLKIKLGSQVYSSTFSDVPITNIKSAKSSIFN